MRVAACLLLLIVFCLAGNQVNANTLISFEGNNYGLFANKGEFDFEIITVGGTPSPNTGPSNGANGTNGYVYFETSNGAAYNAGDQAILLAKNVEADSMSFYYHMFGVHTGNLQVQAQVGGAWQTLSTISGQQHSSHEQSWKFKGISLVNVPKPTNIRFIATAAGDYKGDIAIDEVRFVLDNQTVTTNIETFENNLGLFSNKTEFLVSRTKGHTPTVDTGPTTGANGTATYAYFETSTGAANKAGDTGILEASVTGNAFYFHVFMFGAHMGTLKVKARIGGSWQEVWRHTGQLQGHAGADWHKIYIDLTAEGGYTGIRFEFVAKGGWFGDIAIDQIHFAPAELSNIASGLETGLDWHNKGDYSWLRHSGSTPSSSTGPSSAQEGNYYAFFESSLGNANDAGNQAILESEPVNGTKTGMCYWVHMYGEDTGSLALESSANGSSWERLFILSGQQQSASSDPWAQVCTDFPEDVYKLRFVATAIGGYKGDTAIDNIQVNNTSSSPVNYSPDSIMYYTGESPVFEFNIDGAYAVNEVQIQTENGQWHILTALDNNAWQFNMTSVNSEQLLTLKVTLSDGTISYHSFKVSVANLGDRPSGRRIIFIHTDLLGTPVTETDENGVVQ